MNAYEPALEIWDEMYNPGLDVRYKGSDSYTRLTDLGAADLVERENDTIRMLQSSSNSPLESVLVWRYPVTVLGKH